MPTVFPPKFWGYFAQCAASFSWPAIGGGMSRILHRVQVLRSLKLEVCLENRVILPPKFRVKWKKRVNCHLKIVVYSENRDIGPLKI